MPSALKSGQPEGAEHVRERGARPAASVKQEGKPCQARRQKELGVIYEGMGRSCYCQSGKLCSRKVGFRNARVWRVHVRCRLISCRCCCRSGLDPVEHSYQPVTLGQCCISCSLQAHL